MIPAILLVGLGKMGGAMLAGWQERGLSAAIAVDPTLPNVRGPHVTVVASAEAIPPDFTPACVLFAVKPQSADTVVPLYARYRNAVMLSIMAGRGIAGLQSALGGAAVVRAMPNTPAAIRQGITVACAGPGVTEIQRRLCDTLLAAVGDVAWVEDEALIDPVTAISGGGPAYVFLLAELLEKAALAHGLPPDLARLLARRTVSGSGALLAASSEDAGVLRQNVTSPNGTTERALQVMMAEDAWPRAVSAAIDAATRRSRELRG